MDNGCATIDTMLNWQWLWRHLSWKPTVCCLPTVWWCLLPVRGLKMAKKCRKLPMSAFFAIFRPLTGNKTSSNYFFLVEEVLSFDLVVICENRLRIGFRNEFLTFTSENEVDLDELHILKITLRNGLEIGMGNFPQHFPQEFPARFSRNNFPQDFPARISRSNFPARISHKIFPQQFPARFCRAGSLLVDSPSPYSKC